MKILADGDIHGDTSLVKKLAAIAEKEHVDAVVLCGDITEAEQSVENLIGPFVKKKQKVILLPGNHESIATADFLADLYGATNLHGYAMQYKDIGLFGCGSSNIGLFQLSEKEIYDILKKGDKKVKDSKKKIMVTHVHPSGTKMAKMSNFVPGSTGLEKAVKKLKPDILLCSHVH